jgi:hypothetical protein
MTEALSTETASSTRAVLESSNVQDALDALTTGQRRYVVQSTIGLLPPTAAARDAGFKTPPQGKKVVHALSTLRVALARELDITFDDIKRGMMSAINLAECLGDPAGMLNGWDKIAKLLGHYQEESRNPINIANLTYINMREMSDEELDEIIDQAPVLEGEVKRVSSA